MEKTIEEMKEELSSWLQHPSELGCKPARIVHTIHFEDPDEIQCDVFKYKKSIFGEWMLGIVSDSGTFSQMKKYDESRQIEDAQAILDMLKEYWKSYARKLQSEKS